MKFICPNPQIWNEIYTSLTEFYQKNKNKIGTRPPVPLILNGWVFSSDLDKKIRWEETIKWAKENDCSGLIPEIKESDKYKVENMSIIIDDPYGFEEDDEDKENI